MPTGENENLTVKSTAGSANPKKSSPLRLALKVLFFTFALIFVFILSISMLAFSGGVALGGCGS